MAVNAYVTAAGAAVLSEVIGLGGTLTFVRADLGSGTVTDPAECRAMTALDTKVTETGIVSAALANGVAQVSVQYGNADLTEGFYLGELGVFAKDPVTNDPVLYCYVSFDEPEWIPPATSATYTRVWDIATPVSTVASVSATIDSAALVDQQQLQEDIQTAIDQRGLPSGGTAGQALLKTSSDDYDVSWGTAYTHPAHTARTGKPGANQSPGFGGSFTMSQISCDDKGHVTAATDRVITIPNAQATPSAAGLMSAADKTKLNGIADNANNYTHPNVGALTGLPTADETPGFGDPVVISQVVTNANGHVTALTEREIWIPDDVATKLTDGLMSADDKEAFDTGTLRAKTRPSGITTLDDYKTTGVYFVNINTVPDGWPDDVSSTTSETYSMLEVFDFGEYYGGYVQRLTYNVLGAYPDVYFRAAYKSGQNPSNYGEWQKIQTVGNAEPGN